MPISDAARRNILQTIKREGIIWSGSLEEVEFLSRIFDLDKIPSKDYRYSDARGDIYQHTTMNPGDWPDYWIFDDERFDLLHCSDEKLLRFLSEMIHPVVRTDREEAAKLLELFNMELREEGYEIIEGQSRFGNVRYEARGILPSTVDALDQMKEVAERLGSRYLQGEIIRMQNAVDSDPELAIGTSKEFLETISKTILNKKGVTLTGKEELPELVYLTLEAVKPLEGIEAEPKLIKKTLGSLSTIIQSIGEIRNKDGTGHGKDASKPRVDSRLASLAVNASSTLALFLYQSYEKLES